jgi:hypothetical protein
MQHATRSISWVLAALVLASLFAAGCAIPTVEKKYLTRHEFYGEHSVKYIHHYNSDFDKAEGVDTDYSLDMRVCDVDEESTEQNCKETIILKSVR